MLNGGVTFSCFDFETPVDPFDGVDGNKHLHIGSSSTVTNIQCRLNTGGGMTSPSVDVDGSFDFQSSNAQYTDGFFNVGTDVRFNRSVKMSQGTAAPTTGAWKAGDMVWHNGVHSFFPK